MPTRPTRIHLAALAAFVLLLPIAALHAQPIVDIQVRFVTVGNPFFDDVGVKFDIPPDQQVQIEAEIVFVRMGTVPGFGISGDFGSNAIVRLDSVFSDPPGVLLCETDPSSTAYGCSGASTNPPDTMHAVFNITGVGLGTVIANTNVVTIGDPDTTNNADTTTIVVSEVGGLSRISGAVYLDRVGYYDSETVFDAGTTTRLTGVVVDLLDEGGTLLERDTTTLAGYSFDVEPGTYQVRQQVPDGTYRVFPINPDMHVVSVEAGVHRVNVDFLNTPLIKVNGQKLEDVDKNLRGKDPNDVGLNGWTIRLEGQAITGETIVIETVTADIDLNGDGIPEKGGYEFRVPPGRYEIDEVLQAGFDRTGPHPRLVDEGFRAPPVALRTFETFVYFLTPGGRLREAPPYVAFPTDGTGEDFVNWSIQPEDIRVSEDGSELDEAIRRCNENRTEPPCLIDIEEVIMKNWSGQDGVITLQNPLPTITAPMIINGRGATIDGSLLDGADGLAVSGVGTIIRDLTITNFDGHGIRVEDGGRVNVDSASIANNGGAGIRVADGASANVEATSIFGNIGLAIDLGEEGPTPNNGEDDGVPNAPTITSVEAGDTLFVYVSYQGRDSSSVSFQVFTSSACGPEGTGQGEFLVGGFEAETDSVGTIDMVLAGDTTFVPKRYVSLTATDADGNTSEFSPCDESVATGIENESAEQRDELPASLRLLATYPNPFSDRAEIHFEVTGTQPVRIDVLDVLGRIVTEVLDETKSAGSHTAELDARNLPAGIYFVRIKGEHFALARKMVRVP